MQLLRCQAPKLSGYPSAISVVLARIFSRHQGFIGSALTGVPKVLDGQSEPKDTPSTLAPTTKQHCPICGAWNSRSTWGRTTCKQCGFRFCHECHHYRHRLKSDFCFACGAWFIDKETRRLPNLPTYLEQQLARLISLANLWFVIWLGLVLNGASPWLYLTMCAALAGYWLMHYLRFRRRTGLIQAARYLGGIGLSIVFTMGLLIVIHFWLIYLSIDWQGIQLWAFVLTTLIIIPIGVLLPPVALQARMGAKIVAEAQDHNERWLALENTGYLNTLLLRIPNVRHL